MQINGNSRQKIRRKVRKKFLIQIIGGGGMIPFGRGAATPMILTSPHFQKSKKKSPISLFGMIFSKKLPLPLIKKCCNLYFASFIFPTVIYNRGKVW